MPRRNGRSNEAQSGRECGSSGWLKTALSLAGGIGLGAGLLYLLDPESGQRRRQKLLSGASDLASSASDYAGSVTSRVGGAVGSALSRAGEYASEKFGDARDYAGEAMGSAKSMMEKRICGETRGEHRLGVAICALSSMALGAAVMYVMDPSMGASRRRYAREKASTLASQAGEAIQTGYQQAREKVSDMTSRLGSGSDSTRGSSSQQQQTQPGIGTFCDTGQTPTM